jgi:hypothetical protein
MHLSDGLKKIQNLPLVKRKIIFWLIIIVFGLILCSFYIMNVRYKIKDFSIEKSLEDLKFPNLKKEVEKMPKFETGGVTEELKDDIKEAEKMIEENNGQK